MSPDKIYREKDGSVRCINTLQVIGKWFKVDNIIYYCPSKLITKANLN